MSLQTMPACCVSYCNNRTEKGIRLFMLPQGDRNKERRDAWIKNIKREDLSSKAHVCEVHFNYDQFENHREDGKRTLKNSALPTLFSEEHLKKEFMEDNTRSTRRSTRKRKPVVFEEYQSEDEDSKSSSSQSKSIKIEAAQSSDEKVIEPLKKIELIRCRTCLSTAPKEFSHILKKMLLGKTIKQVILVCVPQMELLDDEYICDKCYRFLLKLMGFIDNCLESEEQLGTGKISLNVDSSDIADISKTAYRTISKKKGRPRKNPIKENNDQDYEPYNISDKITKKRGRKPKIEIHTVSDDEKEDGNTEVPVAVKWGIPNTDDKTIIVRKYGKPKTTDNQEVMNDESINTTITDTNGESNNKLCNSIEPIENIESYDETEMFVEYTEDNVSTKETDSTSKDCILSEISPIESGSKFILADHSYVTEDLVKLLRCPQCMIDYRTLRGIKQHLTTAHRIAEEQSFKCSLCNMKFIRYKDMVKHKSSHGYACELCEDFFHTIAELDSHRSVHPEKYCCVKCGAKFQKKVLLEKHVPLHQMMSRIRILIKNMGRSELQCPHCSLKCGYASALQQHIKTVHLKIKDFECGACHKKFSTSNSLKVHVRVRHSTDTPFVCQECGVGYRRLDYLQKHEQIHFSKRNPFVNPAKRNYSKVSNNTDSFACIFCSVKTSSKEELLVHLQIHNSLRKYECDYCGLMLSCHRTKMSHEKTHKNSDFVYICTTCWKKFPTEQELKTHTDLHECVANKFSCNICNATYARQIMLESHILNEHVENLEKEIESFDDTYSNVDLVEVNRKNIEIEWSTDEEDEEELENDNSNGEEIKATGIIILKKEITEAEKVSLEEEKEEYYIPGMDKDPSMDAAIENGNLRTDKEPPDDTEEEKTNQDINQECLKLDNEKECVIIEEEKTKQVILNEVNESNQDINQEDLELDKEKECVIIEEEKTKQVSLNEVNESNHEHKENEESIRENSPHDESMSLEEHKKENKQSESERSLDVEVVC